MAKKAKKNIYLSGGGGEHDSFTLDGFFFTRIPRHGKLLYVPIALREHKLFTGAENWFRGVIKLHSRNDDIVLETWFDLKGKDFSKLKEFDGVYIGGGNTWSLIKDITESGFVNPLKEYIENGGVYYGGSAGAIICGLRIDLHGDKNSINWKGTVGMDLMNGLSVVCHAKQEQLAELEKLAKKEDIRLITLAENAGAIYNGSACKCVGDGICKIF